MTSKQKLSRRAHYTLLLHDSENPPNEGERAALEAAIYALDRDLTGRMKLHIEASQADG